MTDVAMRALTGFLLGVAIAVAAQRRRTLTTSGAIAAIAVATATWSAGWTWGAAIIAFFVSSTLLSKLGEAQKRKTLDDIVEKGSERDWKQVIANGGPYTVAAIGSLMWPGDGWMLAGAGALASSTADTWATEIGTLSSSNARSILSWRVVPAGTSGGITLPGTLASLAGALFIGIFVHAVGWPFAALMASFTGGFAGSMFDSLLGASIQSRRWCNQCERGTERALHSCGSSTVLSGGISWMDNDMVNVLSSAFGAIIGALWIT